MKKAVILLNMGGPNNESEIELFLKNMFNDPEILLIKSKFWRRNLAFIITHFRKKTARENYKPFKMCSPINKITRNLVEKLNANQSEIKFDYAMNYTPPFADETLKKYADFDEITLFPLYPHFSKTTILSSLQSAQQAAQNLGIKNIKIVDFFYENKFYNEIILDLIRAKIATFSTEQIAQTSLIFSAHSLPQKHILSGDIYEQHINSHVEILRNLLAQNDILFKSVNLAYQSRLGPIKWLSPSVFDTLKNLSQNGEKNVLVFPISFCIDNSETKFELEIFYKNEATKLGIENFNVCECPNFGDKFVNFIKDLSR